MCWKRKKIHKPDKVEKTEEKTEEDELDEAITTQNGLQFMTMLLTSLQDFLFPYRPH